MTEHAAHILPSHLTLAFATTVVRSKPPELSIRGGPTCSSSPHELITNCKPDYISLLRQHIARGRRENALSTAYRHLDRSSYWRSEYERTKVALKVGESETLDLRLEVDALKIKLENARAAVTASPAKKRKKVDQDVIPVPRSPKKVKQTVEPVQTDLDLTNLGEIGKLTS